MSVLLLKMILIFREMCLYSQNPRLLAFSTRLCMLCFVSCHSSIESLFGSLQIPYLLGIQKPLAWIPHGATGTRHPKMCFKKEVGERTNNSYQLAFYIDFMSSSQGSCCCFAHVKRFYSKFSGKTGSQILVFWAPECFSYIFQPFLLYLLENQYRLKCSSLPLVHCRVSYNITYCLGNASHP